MLKWSPETARATAQISGRGTVLRRFSVPTESNVEFYPSTGVSTTGLSSKSDVAVWRSSS